MSTVNASPGSGKRGKTTWLINRNYRLLFIGQGISLIGDQISTYTLILWVITIILPGQSWAPLAVSALMVAGMIPDLLVGPLAGVFVDRWNRRLTMMRMDSLRAGLLVLLLLFTGIVPLPFLTRGPLHTQLQLGALLVETFFISVCSQFFSPANIGLLAEIVPEEDRPQAISYNQTMQSFAALVGPPLAAPLLFSFGIQWALLIDILSYVASLLTLRAIRPPTSTETQAAPHGSLESEFLAGVRVAFGDRLIRMLIITTAIATLGGGAFDALYIFFIQNNLHADVKLTGFVGSFLGAGTIAGAFLAARISRHIGTRSMYCDALLLIGLLILIFSRLTTFPAALGMTFLLGFSLATLRVASGPMLLKEVPNNMLGRLVSIITPLMTCVSLLSTTLAGYFASLLVHFHVTVHWVLSTTFSSIDTIFVGVGCMFLLAALYAYLTLPRQSSQTDGT